MRGLFTLLVLLVLTVSSASAQKITYQPPIDTNSLGFQIPDRTIDELQAHKPVILISYSPGAGIPTRSTRFFYDSSKPYFKESLLIDYVTTNPGTTSQIYKQLLSPVDRYDRNTRCLPVGWIRAGLDAEGRVIRLWGQDAIGRYWVWRGSLPFASEKSPEQSTLRPVVE